MLLDLIDNIKKNSTPTKIISQYNTLSKQGFIFERICDLVIKFGCCDLFSNHEYKHIEGNVNTGIIKYVTSLKKYITNTKIISGKSGGCSDITLHHPRDDRYIFISCKYFTETNDHKNINKYDIQNIVSVINSNKETYKNYEIYLFVNNKHHVLKKVKNANKSSDHITKYMSNSNILDMNDLTKYYKLLQKQLIKYQIDEYDDMFGYSKSNLMLRFHQQLICNKVSKLIEKGHNQILLGAKPRCGKTFICGGIILMLKELYNKFNALVITPAPTETVPQFTEDLFEKYNEFNDCSIIYIDNSKKIKNIKNLLSKKNIIVISKQLLQKYVGDKQIKLPKINIIFFDENHFAGTTDLSKNILDTYSSQSTVRMYLTATYYKPLHEWNIPEECQLFWDIEDEQFCKSRDIDKLVAKHGKQVKKVIRLMKQDGSTIDDIFGLYDNYPDLHLITNMFDSHRYQIIKDEIMDSKYGFSFDVLFSFGNKNKKNFRYSNSVRNILRYISGSNKLNDFKNGDKSIFGRIEAMCEKNESRMPFTQLWFLPTNTGINELSTSLKKLMMEDKILSSYDIMIINSKNEEKMTNIKATIRRNEKIARENSKLGLIILAGNMLTLGITLENCDVVMLLNNTLSADRVMQMMYRSMTESIDGDKKFGFVVDLNISRVIHSCLSYNVHQKDLNIEDKMDYLIKGHLINIDVDLFDNKKINSDLIVSKLLDIWKSDPINNLKTMLKQIENDVIELNSQDQKLLNAYFTKTNDKLVDIEMILQDEEDDIQSIPSGVSDTEESDEESDEELTEELIEEPENKISFTKDVLPFIIPLSCILTISDKNKDFVEMLDAIKNNDELIEVFNDQSMIWWNRKDIIDLVKVLSTKYLDKNSNAYNVTVNFKLSLQSLIDKPKKLLQLIDSCLKPKQLEKKKFGEVFTPMKLIDEMLDKLDEYYFKEHNKSIFTKKSYRWFDPANGMGNFPIAIYLRLMKGLKKKIPDRSERKRHILENMLYMSELNKKNVFICKKIFDINNEYQLNIYQGDSLELDVKEEWGVDKFDVIIGNPPYNQELKRTGALPLYNKFIEQYIDQCKYLSFIVPSRWFSGGKGLDKFRKMMLSRSDIVFINHETDATKIFGRNVNIEGGVNYFLRDDSYEGKCCYNGHEIDLNRFDIIIDSQYYGIIDHVSNMKNSITAIYLGRYFGIESNDKRLKDNGDIKCYVSKQKGFIKYINKKYITKDYKFYKVITARANGKYKCFGNTFIGQKDEVHTGSYISFKVNTLKEAKSLTSYLKTKLANFLLSLRKNSQDISENTCKWIPLPPLDRIWTNEEVYQYYDLSKKQIKLINDTKLLGYK